MIRRTPQRMTESITIRGEEFELLPERAVWWAGRRALLVADLHWGKCEAFQGRGIPLPSGLLTTELERLGKLARRQGADEVIVLGDLIHDAVGITPEVSAEVARWRSALPTPIRLVPGNHDRHLPHLPEDWRIDVLGPQVEIDDDFVLLHHPTPVPGRFGFCGHLHPTYVVRGRGDRLRCACFHVTPKLCVLPAFSEFTNGVKVRRDRRDRIFVVAESSVLEV